MPLPEQEKSAIPVEPIPYRPYELFKSTEDPMLLDKSFIPPARPIPRPHSPKISPSSIPNPNPSIMTSKPVESGYPSYGGYLYSTPGYSAFHPIGSYQSAQQNQVPSKSEALTVDTATFPKVPTKETAVKEKTDNPEDNIASKMVTNEQQDKITNNNNYINNTVEVDASKSQTDFEEQFTPEIIPAVTISEINTSSAESKMNITSLAQGSGATVTIPPQVKKKESIKKPLERFSLKTSIPISKIDMKCVTNPPDNAFQNNLTKNTTSPFNPTFQVPKIDGPRIEIQSNIIIKCATKETDVKVDNAVAPNNNINTLINATEAVNKSENKIWRPESKPEVTGEISKDAPTFTPPMPPVPKPMFNPIKVEQKKVTFSTKPPDIAFPEQKKQILFIQNKSNCNPKMLLTIQQQNPQVILQRTNFDSKNLQAPSRLTNQSKKCKGEVINEAGPSSKVVALKRLHQENCDENDFENLITENQIYGNKIVVKEKSQGTHQEQDLKNKIKTDKAQTETKNVVIQPNFLYLSNVQICRDTNLMMIKNTKVTQLTSDPNTANKTSNELKATSEASTMTNSNDTNSNKITTLLNNNDANVHKTSTINSNIAVSSDDVNINKVTVTNSSNMNVNKIIIANNNDATANKINLTSSNDVVVPIPEPQNVVNESVTMKSSKNVYTSSNKAKRDVVVPIGNQKVIMKPQIIYKVPMPVDKDKKLNQTINQNKIIGTSKKELPKQIDQAKTNDTLFICPYQMDARMQPKIMITNMRPNKTKMEEFSSLDLYEKRWLLRHKEELANYDTNEDESERLTPAKIKAEICKEFAESKLLSTEISFESDSEYGDEELKEYKTLIEDFVSSPKESKKIEFLAGFSLATLETYKEKHLEKQERILKTDSVASAYIEAGWLDRLMCEMPQTKTIEKVPPPVTKTIGSADLNEKENRITLQKKQLFLAHLKLTHLSPKSREGNERTWLEILKERTRRNNPGTGDIEAIPVAKKLKAGNVIINPNDQLKILTEIKKCVNENNNLIKKRLDSNSNSNGNEGESIHVLAEKNFSELNRLSTIADCSVKLLSGKDTRKRDLNPGFDSENIKKPRPLEEKTEKQANVNTPSGSNIVSLKSTQEITPVSSTQATSMDEPQNSAAGVTEMFTEVHNVQGAKKVDANSQAEEVTTWSAIESFIKSFKEYDITRKKEVTDLQRRNTKLRIECAHTTRAASRDSDKAHALLSERQNLVKEENRVKESLEILREAIDVIMEYGD